MNYADTVERVMVLLKERKVCSSSRKSHRDCYESLGLYLTRNNTEYTVKSRDEWFTEIKKKTSVTEMSHMDPVCIPVRRNGFFWNTI